MTLQSDIQRVLDEVDIQAGIAVWHIESDTQVDVNGDQPFPMASAFKIPILATAFHQFMQNKFKLDTRISLNDEDKSLGSGILPYFESGVAPTILDLLTLMMIISDNTATDMVIDLLGGTNVIESYMHKLGLTDIYFKMTCKQLLRALFPDGVYDLPHDDLIAWTAQNDVLRDGRAFSLESDNNISSAKAMNQLLHMIFVGSILDEPSRHIAFDILFKQQFNIRLSRFLPPGTKVAHKTGTIGGIRNDSGIIFINDTNHVILTIFTKWDEVPFWNQPEAHHQRVFEVETAMGTIGRLVYDQFRSSS